MATETENTGTVIFSKGQNDTGDSDIWDDTALVQAYDNAVSNVKTQIVEKSGNAADAENSEQPTPQDQAQKKKSRKNKRKKNIVGRNPANWQIGSRCRAVFTEDGQNYEAIITSLNLEQGTCMVRYLGYGNTEEQQLQDLHKMDSHGSRRHTDVPSSNASVASGAEEGLDPAHGAFPRPQSAGRGRPYSGASNPAGYGHYPSYMQPPPSFMPVMPGAMPAYPGPSFPSWTASSIMPSVPPPPPLEDEESLQSDSEALHSMLIAWYMSGYHTGYYQGLKQGKRGASQAKANTGQRNQRRKQNRQRQRTPPPDTADKPEPAPVKKESAQ